jgi:hypothetical protein
MSAQVEKRSFGGPDPGTCDLCPAALLLAGPWMSLHLAITVQL